MHTRRSGRRRIKKERSIGMTELPQTIREAAAWPRERRISSAALTEALLERAHAAQERIGAFVTITDEAALAAARQADSDFARGTDRSPLQGVPLAIKDLVATADAPTTANSRVGDPGWGTRGDATVVRRLRAAGAVLLGKLTLHEFAAGWPDPDTGLPVARNPWDMTRAPGGSSSGTGAAIAAGLILGGLGTDTSGSIRFPASYCGISGLKPTFGRVSKEGCIPCGYSLDTIGPMARTARDCTLMLEVLAGYDPGDPSAANVPVPSYAGALDGPLAGHRIGVPRPTPRRHVQSTQSLSKAGCGSIPPTAIAWRESIRPCALSPTRCGLSTWALWSRR
jgi:aspartyl-tRNA(Asn)/glutamyl-tRNA(Gln) amidotransferase subunit A